MKIQYREKFFFDNYLYIYMLILYLVLEKLVKSNKIQVNDNMSIQ